MKPEIEQAVERYQQTRLAASEAKRLEEEADTVLREANRRRLEADRVFDNARLHLLDIAGKGNNNG
jgi:hypothetical protein